MAKKPHRIRIDHHSDGSHTKHRHYKHDDGKTSVESRAHQDLDSVHDGLQEHLGAPNPGEAEADAGTHGVPAEHAGPAGLSMPPAAPPAVPGA
jgi:hypothetical protein